MNSGAISPRGFEGFLEKFVRTRLPDAPCPVCGKDWCVVHKSGRYALCQRVPSAERKGDAGWFHRLDRPRPPVTLPPAPAKMSAADVTRRVMEFLSTITRAQYEWLAADLGVRWEGLERLGVGWHPRLGCYTFPMRDANFACVGVRYRFPDGSKRTMKGGSEGLFLPSGTVGGRQVFVTEGLTDCAALLDCGIMAIGRPNCTGGVSMICEIVARHRPQHVVLVADNDGAGVDGATRLREALHALAVHAPGWPSVSVAALRPTQHKDARACARAGGGRHAILDVLAGAGNNTFWSRIP